MDATPFTVSGSGMVIERVAAESETENRLARVIAVAKFRELADRLERGELNGARVQWREGSDVIEVVELGGEVRLYQVRT